MDALRSQTRAHPRGHPCCPQPCAKVPPIASPKSSGADSLQLEPVLPAACPPPSGGRQLQAEGLACN